MSRSTYDRDATIDALFARQAKERPGEIAASFAPEAITYAELDVRSSRLANRLRALGVGPDVPVAIFLPRGIPMLVAWLGTVKAGGAYVPLDPSYPLPRLAFMLEDTAAPVLVTTSALADALPAGFAQVIALDEESLDDESDEAPDAETTAESLAYIVYTSGSTGQPRGIAIPHRGVVRLLFGTNYVDLGPGDRIAQLSNASFDAATFEVWGALLHGGTLVGFGPDVALAPARLAASIREERITSLFLTTALFNQVAQASPDAFATVRDVLFGGERVDPRWVRTVLESGGPRRLLHVYGPTESTTFATFHLVEGVAPDAETVPIGVAVGHTTTHVADGEGREVPPGTPGELLIGGDGLARGYLNRPELTERAFVPDLFSNEPGARLYKTGDLVRAGADGALEFIGRLDYQVKLRGFRIELEEVEAALKKHAAVIDAVVAVREDAPGDRRLVGYVVARRSLASLDAELRAFVAASLPEYMVPAAFVRMDALPLNPNGKVDRGALPAPGPARPELAVAYAAPSSGLETRIAALWRDVLRLDRVGLDDNFFDLGGSSLLLVSAHGRLEKELGAELPITELFDNPTVRALARRVETGSASPLRAGVAERAERQRASAAARRERVLAS